MKNISRWTDLGSYEVAGSVCTWKCELAIRREHGDLWSIRWRGEEQEEEILGPDYLDALAEELAEEWNLDRDELLDFFIQRIEGTAGFSPSKRRRVMPPIEKVVSGGQTGVVLPHTNSGLPIGIS